MLFKDFLYPPFFFHQHNCIKCVVKLLCLFNVIVRADASDTKDTLKSDLRGHSVWLQSYNSTDYGQNWFL